MTTKTHDEARDTSDEARPIAEIPVIRHTDAARQAHETLRAIEGRTDIDDAVRANLRAKRRDYLERAWKELQGAPAATPPADLDGLLEIGPAVPAEDIERVVAVCVAQSARERSRTIH